MAPPSRPPTFSQYGVDRRCYGCQRPLKAKDETALWFVGLPGPGVFASCCFHLAAKWKGTP